MYPVAADSAQTLSAIEQCHLYAQSRHRLRQFQTDRAGADDRQSLRQILKLEDGLVGQQTLSQTGEFVRNEGCRSGGDHDAVRLDLSAIVQLQTMGRNEPRPALQANIIRNFGDALSSEAGEAVTLVAHALHHRPAVDPDRRNGDTERAGGPRRMSRVRSGDQQL